MCYASFPLRFSVAATTRHQPTSTMATCAVRRLSQCLSFFLSSPSCYSTNFLTIPRTHNMNLYLKRKLSYLNFKSFVPSQMSDYPARTSCGSCKVVQGRAQWSYVSPIKLHPFCSVSSTDHSFSEKLRINRVAKSDHMDEEKTDSLLPADGWSSELVDLYKQLTNDLIENGNGDWIEHRTALYDGEKRLFTKAVISEFPGKFFEYQFFFSKKEQRIKGVVQFGPYTQGPPGCVHGGASATMMDAAIGVCVNKSFSSSGVTVSLSMNYKSFLPLGTIALVESKVDKVEGRKVFGSAELKSPDGKVTYVTANAIFIQMNPESYNKESGTKKE